MIVKYAMTFQGSNLHIKEQNKNAYNFKLSNAYIPQWRIQDFKKRGSTPTQMYIHFIQALPDT